MQLRQAADALGVHYQTAYLWVRQGSLPARKRGRGYEVDDADVRALSPRGRLSRGYRHLFPLPSVGGEYTAYETVPGPASGVDSSTETSTLAAAGPMRPSDVGS